MNTESNSGVLSISPAAIEALIRRARAERAQVIRQELAELPALFKRLVARFRPNRERLPQAGILAR